MRIENTSLSQPIQPGLLALNTTRNTGMRGVGFLPIAAITAFAGSAASASEGEGGGSLLDNVRNFFGNIVGAKDPNKDAFDHQRQAIWERFASIVDMKDSYAGGTLTRDQLQRFIANVQSIIAQHDELYNQFRSKIDAAWINPRYNDFDSFFKKVLASWQQELSEMGGMFGDLSTKLAGMDLTTMLLIGGAAFLLLRKGR
jgi:hypothetical protein